ncbi:uncharacterized protein EI90DRAFT_3083031, partial [Cantharellus anzutake]|uniref:uncharacterized protein n=1 Tax=Cantharellus anzutake TaxID=1750568 RepID=UPI00190634DE
IRKLKRAATTVFAVTLFLLVRLLIHDVWLLLRCQFWHLQLAQPPPKTPWMGGTPPCDCQVLFPQSWFSLP